MRTEPPAAFTGPPLSQPVAVKEYDPLRLCIFSTIALISWIITPPLTAAIFASIGVGAYVRARRHGLAKSRCKLGDTRLVITYLAALAIAGWATTAVVLFA
jgi:hypothetical protein